MLIVCDTSPLRYLCELGAVDLLPSLYGAVMTTPLVMSELQLEHFPELVKRWAQTPPPWLGIHAPATTLDLDLDEGEASAISLANERRADRVLIDERKAASLAMAHGLNVTGTLGVLAYAAALGRLDFNRAIQTLTQQTRFRWTPEVIADAQREFEKLSKEVERGRDPKT
jgi:predicted nucleic acid-binding protein